MLTSCKLFLQAVEEYAFIMLNPQGLVQWCNNATYAITGFSNDELSNQSFSIFYTDDDKKRKRGDHELSETLKAGKFSLDSWKLKKDGSKYWSFMSLSPVYNEQHEHLGFAVVLKDITARK